MWKMVLVDPDKNDRNAFFFWMWLTYACRGYCTFHKHVNSEVKSQAMIAFFTAVNHCNGPPRKQNFTLTGSKGQGLGFVIGGFRSVLCVSVFQGSLLVIVIMIDGSEKRNCEGGFEL